MHNQSNLFSALSASDSTTSVRTPFTATCQGEGDPATQISWIITGKTEDGDDVAFTEDVLTTEPECDETNMCSVGSRLRVEEGEGHTAKGVVYVKCGDYHLDCIFTQSFNDGGVDYDITQNGKLTFRL